MHLEKLVTLLKPFDRQRLKRLKEFIQSPYFGIAPGCVFLLTRLVKLHPAFPISKMNPQYIGRSIPRLSTVGKQTNAASHLLKAIELFIAQEEWQKDTTVVARYTLRGFKQMQLDEYFDKHFKKQMKLISEKREQDFDMFYERHLLTELSLNTFSARLNRTAQNNLMPVLQTLDEFCALKKLRYLCEALNRQQVLGTVYNNQHISTILKILEPYTNPHNTYVYLFVNVYRMMEETTYPESSIYYGLLKQFIEKQKNETPSPALCEAADYALNNCLRWYNKGYEEAGTEYLWWIEWKRKNNLLFENEKLMPVTFRNIISIAVISKLSAAEIENLINTYAPHLPLEQHDTYLAFAKGLYNYSAKKYKQAIRFLLQAQAKEEVVFNCIIRQWHFKCLYKYDPNDTDALLVNLHSFEKYLLRNKAALHNRFELYRLFTQYALLLIKHPAHTLNEPLKDLQEQKYFPAKLWLLQQFTAKNKKPVHIAHR